MKRQYLRLLIAVCIIAACYTLPEFLRLHKQPGAQALNQKGIAAYNAGDYTAAAEFFAQAAAQGSVKAQSNLGLLAKENPACYRTQSKR